MSGRYSQDIIDRVKESVDIVDVISSHIELKKSGANYSGLCPFHQEKTPSFSVSPSKQIFHCFGCGEGGNVLSFLMKYENLSFPESISSLAERGGVQLPKLSHEPMEDLSALYKINGDAADFFSRQLASASDLSNVKKYILKRDLTPETIKTFRLGFAPDSWDACLRAMKGDSRDIEKTGIVKRASNGNLIDTFRNRLIFPVIDEKNRVLAFGGRSLDDNDKKSPKYLNSPESAIYRKGRLFYGLNLSGSEIRKKGEALLVEGYMDLITLYQAGIKNVVATSGTAFTEYQCRNLKRYTSNFVMVFDGDNAGRKAAERATKIALEQAVRPKIVMMPTGQDPDDIIRNGGAEAFLELVAEARPYISYLIEIACNSFDISTAEGKADAAKSILPDIAKMTDPIERSGAVEVLSEKLSIPVGRLESRLPRLKGDIVRPSKIVLDDTEAYPTEKVIVRILLDHPDKEADKLGRLKKKDFLSPHYGKLFSLLIDEVDKGVGSSHELLSKFDGTDYEEALRRLALAPNLYEEEYLDQCVADFIKNINARGLAERIKEMKKAAENSSRDEYLLKQKNFKNQE